MVTALSSTPSSNDCCDALNYYSYSIQMRGCPSDAFPLIKRQLTASDITAPVLQSPQVAWGILLRTVAQCFRLRPWLPPKRPCSVLPSRCDIERIPSVAVSKSSRKKVGLVTYHVTS